MEQVGWNQEIDVLSVYRTFEQVEDGRHKRGVRYSVALILTLLLLGKLAGMTTLLVKGRIISADALHTQHAFCRSVTRWEGDYVLIAKDNQPTLADDLRLFFSEPPADCRDWRTARTVDKGHGGQY
jgi:hypothetical protein